MAFDWNEFHVFAKRNQGSQDEAMQRIVVSRAYYAAYHKAQIALANAGMPQHSHLEVWRCYDQSQDPDCQKVGQLGFSLKSQREDADYNANFTYRPKAVEQSVVVASRIINLVAKIYP